ncbi:hypothetical protein [Hazenella coriacea]|uniref:Pilus assembly protein CpaB n=1 Tax=Hazenella coriacea TaxID=1179467 RepID=A0A4R3L7R6_9BACL|nr:hypothetical protein [Hazenella coriacea]TCS94264.1 hypothetical protein EDD58_104133 [Hazenella coriacea]
MQGAKRRAIVFLVLALVLAGVSGVMFLNEVGKVQTALGGFVTVYVADKDIRSRDPLKAEDFRPIEIPEQYVQPSMVTSLEQILVENSTHNIAELISVVPIGKDEVLTSNVLKMQNHLTEENKRMVMISQTENIQFDGSFNFNDRVDIIISKNERDKKSETLIFMKSIPVIGVTKDGKALGLEMTLDQARAFVHEQNFSYAIRILKAPNLANEQPDPKADPKAKPEEQADPKAKEQEDKSKKGKNGQ